MNKEQLARKLALRLGKKASDTKIFVEAFCSTVEDALLNQEKVVLTGFGSFKIIKYKPSQTTTVRGDKTVIDKGVAVHFHAGPKLKKIINHKE